MTPQEHKKLLKENVTKTYKKAPPKVETAINKFRSKFKLK